MGSTTFQATNVPRLRLPVIVRRRIPATVTTALRKPDTASLENFDNPDKTVPG
jgi:hypothetical protein